MKTNYTFYYKQMNLSSFALSFLLIGTLLLLPKHQAFSQQCKMMIDVDFNQWANNRVYSIADAKSDFGNMKPGSASTYRGIKAPGAASNLIGTVKQTTRVIDGTLRAHYTKNDAGGYAGGFLFDPYFDGVEEAYLEYKVKFDKDFHYATGGKLPGLGGSTVGINSETVGKGAIPSGTRYDENGTGFSARLMWRSNIAQTQAPYFILYSYFAKKEDGSDRKDYQNGDGYKILTGGIDDDKWYTIRQYVKLNTPGQNNGTVTMWIDGTQVWQNTKMNIRKAGKSNLKINYLVVNTYRGGNRTDPWWQSSKDEYAFFDDFKVWTGCANPPDGDVDVDEITNVSGPNVVTQGQKVTVAVDYNTSEARDVQLLFQLGEAPWTVEAQETVSVPKGIGTKEIEITIPVSTVVANDQYKFQTILAPTGGGWDNRLDNVEIIDVDVLELEVKGPYSGTPISIPGTLEMENYDKGGADVSYKDTHAENKGAVYRNDGVDIESMGSNEYAVGWISNGEWLEYTVDVSSTGNYDLTLFYSSTNDDSEINITSNGSSMLAGMNLPSTGGYDSYSTIQKSTVSLTEGTQVLRFNIENNGFNIDKIVFAPSTITSINEQSASESIVVYPNPNETGIFNLTHSTEWKVLSVQGQEISTGEGEQIDISQMNKGIYIVQLPHGVAKRVIIK